VIEPSLIKQIDKPAHEKKAYLAYLAFRALLFGNWDPQPQASLGTIPGIGASAIGWVRSAKDCV
jgi:hypothetical protein